MAQTTSAFDAVLKEVYLGPIRSQLNAKTRLLNDFTKADIEQYEWEGRQVIVPLRKARNVGVKANAEDGFLPVAGSQAYAKLVIPMRFVHGRIQLTAQVMKAARSDKGAFARAMESEQQGLVDDIARQRNRYIAGAGRGILAFANGAGTASATLIVDTPGGVAGAANGTRFLKAGMVIALYNAAGTAIDNIATISTVDSATQVTLTANSTWVDNALITMGVLNGTTKEGSLDIEPLGLLGIADSTTYVSSVHGLDRSQAANAFFRSNILASVGTLSPDILQRGIDNTEEVSGEVIDCFYTHASVRREVLKVMEADRRYTAVQLLSPDAGTRAGAFKTDLTFNEIPIRVDKDLPYGILFGVSKSHLAWIPEVEGEWADEDGTILLRAADKDTYEGRFRVFENFFSDKGNSHVRFDGVTATVTSGVYAD